MNSGENASRWNYNHFLIWILSSFFSFCIMFLIIGFPLGLLIRILGATFVMNGVTHITEDYLSQFVAIPLIAVGVGLIQYFVLRRSLARMGWWIWATSLGWMLAFAGIGLNFSAVYILPKNPVVSSFLSGLFIGALIGLAQWLVLRARTAHAGWIIPANALGWGIASMILNHGAYYTLIMRAVTIPNIPTGLALWFLIEGRPGGRRADLPSSGQPDSIRQLSG
jgi:hypothetical protein